MTRLGFQVVLVRDLTDATYDPRKRPFVSHGQLVTMVPMDHILTLLIAERDKLDRAIAALQHRPPGRRSAGKTAQRRRKGMSAAARKAASERMKAYWEARRKQAARRRPK